MIAAHAVGKMFPVEKTSARADSIIVEKRKLERVESSDRAHFPVYFRKHWIAGRVYRCLCFYIRTDKPDTERHSLMDSAPRRQSSDIRRWPTA